MYVLENACVSSRVPLAIEPPASSFTAQGVAQWYKQMQHPALSSSACQSGTLRTTRGDDAMIQHEQQDTAWLQ
jgi:hypothetical protein